MLVMPKMPRWEGEAAGVVRYDGGAHEASLMVSAPLVWSRALVGRNSLDVQASWRSAVMQYSVTGRGCWDGTVYLAATYRGTLGFYAQLRGLPLWTNCGANGDLLHAAVDLQLAYGDLARL